MTQATHFGHCQCCGRIQKLPKGLLSLHGYTVEHGWFSGTCRGAKYLPFEQSCDQVERYVAEAKSALAHVESYQAQLRQPATEPKGWQHTWVSRPNGMSGYVWEVVEVLVEMKSSYAAYSYVGLDGKLREGYRNGFDGAKSYENPGATVEDLRLMTATLWNTRYADTVLEREAKNLRSYIKWQSERVAGWKPQPLLPVKPKGKDTAEFVPNQ